MQLAVSVAAVQIAGDEVSVQVVAFSDEYVRVTCRRPTSGCLNSARVSLSEMASTLGAGCCRRSPLGSCLGHDELPDGSNLRVPLSPRHLDCLGLEHHERTLGCVSVGDHDRGPGSHLCGARNDGAAMTSSSDDRSVRLHGVLDARFALADRRLTGEIDAVDTRVFQYVQRSGADRPPANVCPRLCSQRPTL